MGSLHCAIIEENLPKNQGKILPFYIEEKQLDKVMLKFNPEDFARCVVHKAIEMAKSDNSGYNETTFAEAVWGGIYPDPRVVWRQMRLASSNKGKARNVSVIDLVLMANALKTTPGTIIYEVQEALKKGWNAAENDVFSPADAAPGRRPKKTTEDHAETKTRKNATNLGAPLEKSAA